MRATQQQSYTKHTTSGNLSEKESVSPRFLENISMEMASRTNIQRINTIKSSYKLSTSNIAAPDIESGSELQFKYAILMDVPVEEVVDDKSLAFIEEWYGTPYRLGGNTKQGIDCSAFTLLYAATIYGMQLPRTSREQRAATTKITKTDLQEGDLVFFTTRKNRTISHVGIYLRNNKFVHASSSGGIMISDLEESYWRPRFVGAGRMHS